MKFLGVALRQHHPEELATFLSRCLPLKFSVCKDGYQLSLSNGALLIYECADPPAAPSMPEGYYTGLDHLAFYCSDPQAKITALQENGICCVGGNQVSYNPLIWGTGMDYINAVSSFAFGVEFCNRLDLPEKQDVPNCELEHVGIPTANLEESLRFYHSLGFSAASEALIHRESDGRTIHVAMIDGCGTFLELYEFLDSDHAPLENGTIRTLQFSCTREEYAHVLSLIPQAAQSCDVLTVKAPGSEQLEFYLSE